MSDLKQKVLENQRLAADPNYNVWVNASAGSGKTKVLVDRILRLLLVGANPSSILCITFTKAAALEMQERLHQHLEAWVLATDEGLLQRLATLDPNLMVSIDVLLKARRLFNQVLDEPVQIQTIHSLAQQLLKSAGEDVDAPFGVELAPEIVIEKIIQSTVSEVLCHEDLSGIYTFFSRTKFQEIVQAILQDRAFFRFVLMKGIEDFKTRLSNYLQNPRVQEAIINDVVTLCSAFQIDLKALLQHADASEQDRQWLESLQLAWQEKSLESLCSVFLTTQGTLRKRLLSKKLIEAFPSILNQLMAFGERVIALDQELKRWKLFQSSVAAVEFAEHFLVAYTYSKQELGVWDYDDLIFRALELLSTPGSSENILFQMDQHIDHILVDEAQDTNMYQWRLLDGIIEGVLQRQELATVFVVGDHKQSIFGFQGTDPDIFDTMASYYQAKPSFRKWKQLELNISFRTLQGVLDKIDAIFQNNLRVSDYTKHIAFRGKGGRFCVHPLVQPHDTRDVLEVFASEIVDEVEAVAKGLSRGTADIMLLIRRRGEHLDALQQELNSRGIAFSSPNRKMIYEDPVVELIARLIVLKAQPKDNENVLQILLNPLLGYCLKALTWAEKAIEQQQDLAEYVHEVPVIKTVLELLQNENSFDEMYRKMLATLILQLPVDERNVTNALACEELYRVTHLWQESEFFPESWIRISKLNQTQISTIDDSSLQLMTVHGAKGLQSRVVMLVDTIQLPVSRYSLIKEDSSHLILCVADKGSEPEVYQSLKSVYKEKEFREYYRLLYVALTRAEDEVHLWGCEGGARKIPEDSWYRVCENAVN